MPAIDTDTVRKEIRDFITDTFLFDDTETFEDSDSFMQQGIIDSTGVLEVTAFLESQYGITVEDDEMIPTNLDSVENLVNYIHRKKS